MPDIPSYEGLDENATTPEPPDLGSKDIDEIECGDTILDYLNNYVMNADDEAAVVLNIMSGSLDTIIQKKSDSASALANASTVFETFESQIETINSSYSASLESILTDQNAASAATISVSTEIKNMLSGISFADTTAEELTLLIESAKTKLADAEAHLATTLSFKNDLYAEVANIVADVTAAAANSAAEIDNWKAIADTLKVEAEQEKLNIDTRFTEIEILYGHTHGNTYYTTKDSSTGCYNPSPSGTQDLEDEWKTAYEYVTDAAALIDDE